MKSKLIITSILLCTINISAFCQFDKFNTFEELNSIAITYYQKNNFDSLILIDEYARIRFPEHDEGLTYMLSYLYIKTKQDSKTLENWDYGLKKRYFFGINDWKYKQFENNPEFNRLLKIDKQIGDSLSNLAHVEYEVVLPTNYSKNEKYPILFVFHGNNWNLEISKNVWSSKIVKEKFITVYMQSYIYMRRNVYKWRLNDEKTDKEFNEIFEQIIKEYSVNEEKIVFTGMSAGGMIAIDYIFNEFVPCNGLVIVCPAVPSISDSSIEKFVNQNKKIGIITGENDFALEKQKALINKVTAFKGNNRFTIKPGIGHEVPKDLPTLLDEYLNWILE
jgi:dienelactone hydrolase